MPSQRLYRTKEQLTHCSEHVYLRPHQIPLLAILFWTFHDVYKIAFTSEYRLYLYRFLIVELSEVSKPKSFQQIIQHLENGQNLDTVNSEKLVEIMRTLPELLKDTHRLTEFFSDLPILWNADEDDLESPIERRSLFGLFGRRAYVNFKKLSFSGASTFVEDFQAWAKGDTSRGYQTPVRDAIRNDDYLIRTQHDSQPFADPGPFADFEKARANGDRQVASESLRRFFEQRFSESTDSELRQHAMLNLIRTYIFNGQVSAAQKLLLEAITVARTSGDNIVLQQCMALLRRIEGKTRSQREPLNELQADIPALEVLNDVGKLLREAQPLSDGFEKIVEALVVYDLSRDSRDRPPNQQEQWAFHSMQAVLWRLAGCERLATIEENIVLAFTESGGPDDTRFTMLQNRAAMFSRQGRENEAFSILIDPGTWKGLDYSLNQVAYWTGELWLTMLHFASRRGQQRVVNEFLKPLRPGSFIAWKDFFFLPLGRNSVSSNIEGQLYRALQARKVNQSTTSVDHILKGIWQSEYQGRFRSYRLSTILLADVGLEFGMTVWSRKLMEEIMPQIINGDDIELRAFGCFVLARCIVACSTKNPSGVKDALPYLQIAEEDYRLLEIYPSVQDVIYVTALVYNILGDEKARDEAAKRHEVAGADVERTDTMDVSKYWPEIWEFAGEVCARLTFRGDS
ncbi:imaginal discs arrested [Pyrrhoderma noxium]|uniref:Anaphase-promoting complex subunit 5 n=1 Tax=Pyrrhoderma noxium TaxID=2282107 RepID=A0A286UUD1_9AGAM|nr:imaginal discs arrested [Pyrrhoderma noxium]